MSAGVVIRGSVVVFGLGLCAALSQPPPKAVSKVSMEVVPNALVIKVLGRSQLDFVADLFWVRMANMAGRANSADECAALLPIANLIADLAPRFKYPYFVGGVLAPVRQRDGSYANVDGALALMTRGTKVLPEYTRLQVQKAYTELEMKGDKAAAGASLREAALQGAPGYVARLSTRLLAQAGDYDAARDFARTMAASEDPQLKADFELRLKQIDLEEVLVQVEAAASRYAAAEGHITTSVEALVQKGYLPKVPEDPFGGTIELTVTGARSTSEPRRLRSYVPRE